MSRCIIYPLCLTVFYADKAFDLEAVQVDVDVFVYPDAQNEAAVMPVKGRQICSAATQGDA